MIEDTERQVQPRSEGIGVACAEWEAGRAAERLWQLRGGYGGRRACVVSPGVSGHLQYPGIANWAVSELIEAAVRNGDNETAAAATR